MEAEPWIRMAAFGSVFAAIVAWEVVAPRRPVRARLVRWPNNLALFLVDVVVVRLLFPAAAVGAALVAAREDWGLLNLVTAPQWFEGLAALAVLDLAIYVQHVLFHRVPVLWRLHRVHHADTEVDVTTGLRFHPVEIVLSMAIKIALVVALGAPAWAVLVFEVLLNATSMFNHASGRMPAALDRILRRVVVTPDMHRVHHSVRPEETNSNYGFNVPWWDRLFGTYRARPAEAHETMALGLVVFRERRDMRLAGLLWQPLR